jgi:hypothetical protein
MCSFFFFTFCTLNLATFFFFVHPSKFFLLLFISSSTTRPCHTFSSQTRSFPPIYPFPHTFYHSFFYNFCFFYRFIFFPSCFVCIRPSHGQKFATAVKTAMIQSFRLNQRASEGTGPSGSCACRGSRGSVPAN